MTSKTITIEKEIGSGDNMKKVSKSGPCVVVETENDVLTLLQEDSSAVVPDDASDSEKKRIKQRVIQYLNYAFDLKTRAKLTQQLASEHADPNKAFDAMIAGVNKFRLSIGQPAFTDAEVAAQRKAAGL